MSSLGAGRGKERSTMGQLLGCLHFSEPRHPQARVVSQENVVRPQSWGLGFGFQGCLGFRVVEVLGWGVWGGGGRGEEGGERGEQ